MKRFAVIDFETTGLSPNHGARATEIGIVIMEDGNIVDRYQSLMNSGTHIPYFIQNLTGITNDMVRKAPSSDKIMREAYSFVNGHQLIAHNAIFDFKFWEAELTRLGVNKTQPFICSLLLARRVFPDSPNHKLATLVNRFRLPTTGNYHRALADAEATAYFFHHMSKEIKKRYNLESINDIMYRRMMKTNKANFDALIKKHLQLSN
jgi:DNA polymerase III subunit epsilon